MTSRAGSAIALFAAFAGILASGRLFDDAYPYTSLATVLPRETAERAAAAVVSCLEPRARAVDPSADWVFREAAYFHAAARIVGIRRATRLVSEAMATWEFSVRSGNEAGMLALGPDGRLNMLTLPSRTGAPLALPLARENLVVAEALRCLAPALPAGSLASTPEVKTSSRGLELIWRPAADISENRRVIRLRFDDHGRRSVFSGYQPPPHIASTGLEKEGASQWRTRCMLAGAVSLVALFIVASRPGLAAREPRGLPTTQAWLSGTAVGLGYLGLHAAMVLALQPFLIPSVWWLERPALIGSYPMYAGLVIEGTLVVGTLLTLPFATSFSRPAGAAITALVWALAGVSVPGLGVAFFPGAAVVGAIQGGLLASTQQRLGTVGLGGCLLTLSTGSIAVPVAVLVGSHRPGSAACLLAPWVVLTLVAASRCRRSFGGG